MLHFDAFLEDINEDLVSVLANTECLSAVAYMTGVTVRGRGAVIRRGGSLRFIMVKKVCVCVGGGGGALSFIFV